MAQFPADAPIRKVMKALERLGLTVVREGNHIAMIKENPENRMSIENGYKLQFRVGSHGE